MKIEVKTIADRPLYRRVPSTRDAINRQLIQQLIDKGIIPESIKIEATDILQNGRCCPVCEVLAWGIKTKKTKE